MSSKWYSEEFKIEAVKQVTERGYPAVKPLPLVAGTPLKRRPLP